MLTISAHGAVPEENQVAQVLDASQQAPATQSATQPEQGVVASPQTPTSQPATSGASSGKTMVPFNSFSARLNMPTAVSAIAPDRGAVSTKVAEAKVAVPARPSETSPTAKPDIGQQAGAPTSEPADARISNGKPLVAASASTHLVPLAPELVDETSAKDATVQALQTKAAVPTATVPMRTTAVPPSTSSVSTSPVTKNVVSIGGLRTMVSTAQAATPGSQAINVPVRASAVVLSAARLVIEKPQPVTDGAKPTDLPIRTSTVAQPAASAVVDMPANANAPSTVAPTPQREATNTPVTASSTRASAVVAKPAKATAPQSARVLAPAPTDQPVTPVEDTTATKVTPDAQPAQPAALQTVQAAPPDQTAVPVQSATPASAPLPDASSTPSANVSPQKLARTPSAAPSTNPDDDAAVPPTHVPSSSTDNKAEPTLAAATAVATSTSSPAPLPAAHEIMNRTSASSSGSAIQQETSSAIPAPKVPLVPQAENFAFAVRMLGAENSSSHSPLTQSNTPVGNSEIPVTTPKPAVTEPQSSDTPPTASVKSSAPTDPRVESQASGPEAQKTDTGAPNASGLAGPQQTSGVTPHWNDAAVWQAPEIGSASSMSEPTAGDRASLPIATQEAHLLAPEMPKTSASSEILLHLTDNDQTSAAIRVAERAGTVNVSVHASDPVLRESLRSNLGELSTQLNDQGWKADVMKSAAVAAQSGSQQDSHQDGQRGSQQQQSFGGDRQPQRDRRANGGQWQLELDQETSGGDAPSGGNG
jgi:hypothetical protein